MVVSGLVRGNVSSGITSDQSCLGLARVSALGDFLRNIELRDSCKFSLR